MNNMHCAIYSPSHEDEWKQCKDVCGVKVAQQVADGKIGSMSCIAFGNYTWDRYDGK